MTDEEYVTRGINLKQKQNEWIDKNSINLSAWVRNRIDKELEKEKCENTKNQ